MNVTQVLPPTLVGIGLSLGVTLAVGFAMAPHDANAMLYALGGTRNTGTDMGIRPR